MGNQELHENIDLSTVSKEIENVKGSADYFIHADDFSVNAEELVDFMHESKLANKEKGTVNVLAFKKLDHRDFEGFLGFSSIIFNMKIALEEAYRLPDKERTNCVNQLNDILSNIYSEALIAEQLNEEAAEKERIKRAKERKREERRKQKEANDQAALEL